MSAAAIVSAATAINELKADVIAIKIRPGQVNHDAVKKAELKACSIELCFCVSDLPDDLLARFRAIKEYMTQFRYLIVQHASITMPAAASAVVEGCRAAAIIKSDPTSLYKAELMAEVIKTSFPDLSDDLRARFEFIQAYISARRYYLRDREFRQEIYASLRILKNVLDNIEKCLSVKNYMWALCKTKLPLKDFTVRVDYTYNYVCVLGFQPTWDNCTHYALDSQLTWAYIKSIRESISA